VTMSADRTCTALFTAGFTDDPIVAGSTVVRAEHVTELRTRIDQLRATAGLTAFAWTDSALPVGALPIRTIHITEMRTALGAVYTAVKVPPPQYTDATLAPGDTIKAVHVAEIRSAVVAIE